MAKFGQTTTTETPANETVAPIDINLANTFADMHMVDAADLADTPRNGEGEDMNVENSEEFIKIEQIDETKLDVSDIKVEQSTEVKNETSATKSIHAIIYCRVSSRKQSMEAQLHACQSYCEANGYEVIDTVTEVGSAFKKHQPKLRAMLKDKSYHNKNIRLVIYKVCRFSRRTSDCDEMIRELNGKQITLESVVDSIDLSSPIGQHKFREAISLCQLESEQISDRVRSYHKYKVANNIRSPRSPRTKFGFRLSADRLSLVRVEKEQAIIDFILSVYNTRKNSEQLTERLYALMRILGKPEDHFVPAAIGNKNSSDELDSTKKVKITSLIISDLFNVYNITKRGLPWTQVKILRINKERDDMGLSRLSL